MSVIVPILAVVFQEKHLLEVKSIEMLESQNWPLPNAKGEVGDDLCYIKFHRLQMLSATLSTSFLTDFSAC